MGWYKQASRQERFRRLGDAEAFLADFSCATGKQIVGFLNTEAKKNRVFCGYYCVP